MKRAIGELEQEMQEADARTLGEHLSRTIPEQKRLRNRYISRGMIEHEFTAIWQAQAQHHADLMREDLRKQLHYAIFHQRPLKSPKRFIGFCDLERDRRRAPLAVLAAQRHRLLQKVNDLRFISNRGEVRDLSREERAKLALALETKGEMTFAAIRRLLSLKDGRLNFETEGEKTLVGNRTAAKLVTVFGEARWAELTPAQRDQVVEDLRTIHNPDARRRRAANAWGLDEGAAARFADIVLEDGHHSLSRQALARVLPLMEQGEPYATARKACYPDRAEGNPRDLLPPLDDVMEVRNPTVQRALTELRKLVNAVVRQYGKPSYIRIELARDLKRNRKQRQDIHFRNIANRKDRETAAAALLKERGITSPRRSDVEKWLLAEECRWICPYSSPERHISVEALFGDAPQFQVEHIIPFPRCLDDSFLNKTLCHVDENRRKGNRTPWEAYHGTPQWDDIIGRVKGFSGGGRGRAARNPKLRRFQMEEIDSLDDFVSQQLNDTRYASRLAVTFVAQLYGAGADGVDPHGRRCVQASRGQVTAHLRDQWLLNSILGGGEKTREDHRHHAIDAVVVALTDPGAIKHLSDAAAQAESARRRRFAPLSPPWPAFLDDVRSAVDTMVVSHRVSRKVAGPMHEETIYGRPRPDDDGRPQVHIRKPIEALSAKDVSTIVDPAVRRCVEEKLAALGESDPAKAFKTPDTHPTLRARDGRDVPIHKVRIRRSDATQQIGLDAHPRQVKLANNHHVEIIEPTDARGRVKWEGVVVSTYEAMQRLRNGAPVIQRDHGPGKRFLFSLAPGEVVELDDGTEGDRRFYVVRKVTRRGEGNRQRVTIGIVGVNDARMSTARGEQEARELKEPSAEVLHTLHCRKVLVTPLGEVRDARD